MLRLSALAAVFVVLVASSSPGPAPAPPPSLSLTIDLDAPSAALSAEWLSLPELSRWADLLVSGFTPPTLSKLRVALTSPSAVALSDTRVLSSSSSTGSQRRRKHTFSGSLSLSLAEWIRRDIEDSFIASLAYSGSIQPSGGELFPYLSVSPANLVVAFEVGTCGKRRVRRVHFDFAGCVPAARSQGPDHDDDEASFDPADNPLMTSYISWANFSADSSGFKQCANSCRDGVMRISDAWSLRDPLGTPTKLVIFSTSPVAECTALHLLTSSKFFGIPAPPVSSFEKAAFWSDDRVAIMVGDQPKSSQCMSNIDSALAPLPFGSAKEQSTFRASESGRECEALLDSLDWKMFAKVYDSYVSQDAEAEKWPSFSQIFFSYSTRPLPNWNATFGSLPCSEWSKLGETFRFKKADVQIPTLNLLGPEVEDFSELMFFSLKLALSNPNPRKNWPTDLPESFIRKFSQICDKCKNSASISYNAIAKAANEVTALPCKSTVLGGRGDRLAEFFTARRSEINQLMLGLNSIASQKLLSPNIADSYQRYYFDYEDEYWRDVDNTEKSRDGAASGVASSDGGVLGGLFSKEVEVSDMGRLVNLSETEAVVFFDRRVLFPSVCSMLKLYLAILSLKYTVGRHTLVPIYIRLSHEINIPFEAEFGKSSGQYKITSISREFGAEGFEDGAVLKFSSDGSRLEMDIYFKRDMFGRHLLHVGFGFSKSSKMDEFSIPIVCGYTPEISKAGSTNIRLPLSNQLVDWFSAISEPVAGAPIRYHVVSVDVKSQSENTPYLSTQLSFLTAQSPVIALQNANHFGPHSLNLPPVLKSKIALTDVCGNFEPDAFSAFAGSGRLLFRSDLLIVESCLEKNIYGMDEIMFATGSEIEMPSLFILTSKKDKTQKLMVINVNWGPRDVRFRSKEVNILLFCVEYSRLTYGLPIVVAGAFNDNVGELLGTALEVSGLWRNFFVPPTSRLREAFIWAPSIPVPFEKKLSRQMDLSFRHAPHSLLTSVESCLAPSPSNAEFGSCEPLKEYGKFFRRAVGGIIADERLLAPHESCAAKISGHLPVVYTLDKGEKITVVTFNIGGLSVSRIVRLQKENPMLFPYLSSFDIVLLQTTRYSFSEIDDEEDFDCEVVGDKLASVLSDEMRKQAVAKDPRIKKEDYSFTHYSKRYSKSKFGSLFDSDGTVPTNLHILAKDIATKKGIPKRLQMVACTSESYGPFSSLLGCLFRVKEGNDLNSTFFLSTLDDTLWIPDDSAKTKFYSPSLSRISNHGQDRSPFIPPVFQTGVVEAPLTNPNEDLPAHQKGVMKRLYASLCLSFLNNNPPPFESESELDCSRYPVLSAFVGTWGWTKDFLKDQRRGKLNATFSEFRGLMDDVESVIARKNRIGKPSGLRIRVVVPSERSSNDYLKHLYGGQTAASPDRNWFTSEKDGTYSQWPYWTDASGHVSDYMVLLTRSPTTGVDDSGNEAPVDLAYVDPFLGSNVCNDSVGSMWCISTAPACMPDKVDGAAGVRFEAGGRGMTAKRRWSSLFGEDTAGYNGAGRYASPCQEEGSS
ncbi:hypothetical protein HDU84_007079 [Entophlyctis sp. JEL0112]|nr:hypothetical protein HDU84_007079 [Entophlyctis sp. JEL0112]